MEKEETITLSTGSKRTKLDDVRFDLVSPYGLKRLAGRYALGATKYADHNWRKGQPFSVILNHIKAHINKYELGDESDDNLAAAAWGLFALMEFEETKPELNDLYFWTSKKESKDE